LLLKLTVVGSLSSIGFGILLASAVFVRVRRRRLWLFIASVLVFDVLCILGNIVASYSWTSTDQILFQVVLSLERADVWIVLGSFAWVIRADASREWPKTGA
jgi:hypothetical protein